MSILYTLKINMRICTGVQRFNVLLCIMWKNILFLSVASCVTSRHIVRSIIFAGKKNVFDVVYCLGWLYAKIKIKCSQWYFDLLINYDI